MELNNKVFVINNKEYLVIEDINYNGKQYVYLENNKNERDTIYREVLVENNSVFLKEIDQKLFDSKILNMFIEKLKK